MRICDVQIPVSTAESVTNAIWPFASGAFTFHVDCRVRANLLRRLEGNAQLSVRTIHRQVSKSYARAGVTRLPSLPGRTTMAVT
jgi:hypothetical protein